MNRRVHYSTYGLRHNRGIVLIIVLWMLALSTIIAASYSTSTRTEILLTSNFLQTAKSRSYAEAGITRAVYELLKPQNEQLWRHDGTSYTFDFDGQVIHISIQDEAGKIDLNTGRVKLIDGLLQTANLEEQQHNQLLDAILDWRDKDNLTRLNGAEDDDYEALGLTYGAKDGPFNSVDELLQVIGITHSVFEQIKDMLTVHSRQTGINMQVAPRGVLLAISDMTDVQIDDFLADRETQENDTTLATSFPAINKGYLTTTRSRTFTITSKASVNGSVAIIRATMMLGRNKQKPYTILAWQDGIGAQQSQEAISRSTNENG